MEPVVAMEVQTEFAATQGNEEGVAVVEIEIHADREEPVVANGTPPDQGAKTEPAELRLLGKELRKRFGRKYYKGTITNYDADTRWYKVLYEDGDFEDLELTELEPLLITEQPKRRAGPTSPRGNKRRKTRALDQVGDGQDAGEDQDKQAADEVVAEPEQENAVVETTKYVVVEELQGGGGDGEDAAMQEATTQNEDTTVADAGHDPGAAEDTVEGVVAEQAAQTPKRRGRPPKAKTDSEAKAKSAKQQATPIRKSSRLSTPAKPSTETKETAAKSKGKASDVQEKADTRSGSKGKRVEKAQEESAHQRGMKLKGRKLEKEFDGVSYKGEVANYDRQNKYYKIHYADGDEEELTWGELKPLLVPLEGETSADDEDAAETSTPVPRSSLSRRLNITTVRKTKLVQTVTKATPRARPRRKASVVS